MTDLSDHEKARKYDEMMGIKHEPIEPKKNNWPFIITMSALFIIGLGIIQFSPPLPEKKATLNSHEAKIIAENQVKKRLKSPSTADFSGLRNTSIQRNNLGQWVVKGYVDSQNSFGAIIRSSYSCTVYMENGNIMFKNLTIY